MADLPTQHPVRRDCVAGRMEEAKERLRHAIELDKEGRKLAQKI